MRRQNIGAVMMIAGFIVFLGGIVWAGVSSQASGGEFNAASILLLFGGLILCGAGYFLACASSREEKEKMAKRSAYRPKKIDDYKQELASVREKFNADPNPEKNKIGIKRVLNYAKPYYDFGVIQKGKIYYAALVQVNSAAFKRSNDPSSAILPGVVVYGTDEYYESHPQELKKIAKELYANKRNNILRNELKYFSNVRVDDSLTGGREVYMTTIMIFRKHLPLQYVTGWLFPVIAAPGESTSVFVVDADYWTKDLIAKFIHGDVDEDNEDNEEKPVRIFEDFEA